MKTATLALGNTRSAVRRMPGSGLTPTRYRRPRVWAADLTASSGRVSRPLLPCITARTAGEDAQEAPGLDKPGSAEGRAVCGCWLRVEASAAPCHAWARFAARVA